MATYSQTVDVETLDYSVWTTARETGSLRQMFQTWSHDKNYTRLCFDIDYEYEENGPGYVWITTRSEDPVYRIRSDAELSTVLTIIFDKKRPARPLKAGMVRDVFWGLRTIHDPLYCIHGLPFLKMRLCDYAARGDLYQVVVDI